MKIEEEKDRSNELRERLLQAGAAATQKIYQELLIRIKSGQPIKRSEYRLLKELEKEIEGGDGREEARVNGYMEAAVYCGISKRMLSYHIKRGNLRQNPDGSFDREELDRWLLRYGRKVSGANSIPEKRMLADLRYRVARAEKEEMIVSQLRSELVNLDEIAEAWGWRVSETTAALQALIDRLPPLLLGKDRLAMQEIIREEVWTIRDRFARDGKYTFEKATASRAGSLAAGGTDDDFAVGGTLPGVG